MAEDERGYWIAEMGYQVSPTAAQQRRQLLIDDLTQLRLQLGESRRGEVRLKQLAVSGVEGRVGGGQHVDRIAERRDRKRDRATIAVAVQEAHQVGRELGGTADHLANERRVGQRREKVNRRRQIDPTTCERDYTADEVEFMHALDQYKRTSGRMFPTCSEVLEVIRALGYEKRTMQSQDNSPPTIAV